MRSCVCCNACAEVWPAPAAVVRVAQGTPSLEELKLQYYRLNIQFHQQEHNYLEICRCYRAIYDTPSIVADDTAWKQVRKCRFLATCSSLSSTDEALILQSKDAASSEERYRSCCSHHLLCDRT